MWISKHLIRTNAKYQFNDNYALAVISVNKMYKKRIIEEEEEEGRWSLNVKIKRKLNVTTEEKNEPQDRKMLESNKF